MTGEQIFIFVFTGICMIVGLTIIIAGHERDNRRLQESIRRALKRDEPKA